MFEGLDNVDWHGIGSHVYGENETIPSRIRHLTSEDQDVREKAADFLFGGGQDIGSIYASTAYIIPFALQVIAEDPPITKHLLLLDRLAAISGGGVYTSGSERISISQQRAVLHAYDAMERGEGLYHNLLQSPKIEVRLSALELLGGLSESAERLVPILINHFAREPDTDVQRSAVEFIGRLLYYGDYTYNDLRKEYATFFQQVIDSDRVANVRYAAAEWAVRSAVGSYWNERLKDDEVSASVIDTLIEWFKDGETSQYYEDDIIELLSRAGAMEALTKLMDDPESEVDQVHKIARALLALAYSHPFIQYTSPLLHYAPLQEPPRAGRIFAFRIPDPFPYVLPRQAYDALKAIVNCDLFWTLPTNMFAFFFALPDTREELRALLTKN